jgi:hypothetical protein
MDENVRKVTIKSTDDAIKELINLKKEGKELKGSAIEKQIQDLAGNVSNVDVALSVLRGKLHTEKTEKADKMMDLVADKTTDDPNKKIEVKKELERILKQDDFKTEEEDISDLAKTIAGDEEITAETKIKAKKAKTVLNEWEKNNPEEARSYREETFKDEFVKKTEEENGGLTEKQKELVRQKAELVSKIYYSDGGIENQRNVVVESTRESSPGQARNSWSDLQAITGFMKLEPNETDTLIANNNEIDAGLAGVKIPYEHFSQVRSFDDITAMLSSGSSLEMLKSIQSGGNFLGQTMRNVKRFTTGWADRGAVEVMGNFASRIGNQAAVDFVKNSMGILLQNGLKGGVGTILNGIATKGTVAALGSIGGIALSGPVGWGIAAAGLLKKSLGKITDKLGLSSKKFLENNFGKVGGAVVEGLAALIALPAVLLGSISAVIIGPVIIGVIIGLFFANQYTASSLVSSLVPNVPKCGGLEQDYSKGNIDPKCDQTGKVMGTNQCSEDNSKLSLNSHCSGNTVCANGCGMVSVSIILQCHDVKNTPKCLLTPSMGCKSSFFTHQGACPISWTSMSEALTMNLGKKALFNNGKKISCNKAKVSEMLCSGWLAIVHFRRAADGTGHWLVAAGVTTTGDILLADPSYSDKKFNYWSDFISDRRAHSTYCLFIKADSV